MKPQAINLFFLENQKNPNLDNIKNKVLTMMQELKKRLSHSDKIIFEVLTKMLCSCIESLNNDNNLALPSIIENIETIIKINYKLNLILFNRNVNYITFYSIDVVQLSFYFNILSTFKLHHNIFKNTTQSVLDQFIKLEPNNNRELDLSNMMTPKDFITHFNNTYNILSNKIEDATKFKKHISLVNKYREINYIHYIPRSKNKIRQGKEQILFKPTEEMLNYENILSEGYCNGLERVSSCLSKKELYHLHQKFINNQLSLANDFKNLLDKKLYLPIKIIFIGTLTMLHRVLAFENSSQNKNSKEIKNILIELNNTISIEKIISITPRIFAIAELKEYIEFDRNGLYGLALEAYQLGQDLEYLTYDPIYSIQFFNKFVGQLGVCISELNKNNKSWEIIKFIVKRLNASSAHTTNLKIKYNKLQHNPVYTIELFDSNQSEGAVIFKLSDCLNETLKIVCAKILSILKQNKYAEITIEKPQEMPNFFNYKLEIKKIFHNLYNTKTRPVLLKNPSNKTIYIGNIINGYFHDKNGKYNYANGDSYSGEFKYGKVTGTGIYTWKNGGVYMGNFINGHITGKGCFYSSTNTKNTKSYIYEGEFIDGKITGKGKMVIQNYSIYEGQFINGNLINGTISWNNGNSTYYKYIYQ